MRNPFRRQTETAAPTLHERAAALREGLNRQDPAPGERADLYDRLLTLYGEDREARPVQGREDGTVASRAAVLVSNRLWALARETIAMPLPKTLDGLRATALASAILCEAEHSEDDPTTLAAIGVTRAALSVTGTPLPPGFVGFGDEADHEARDDALFAKPGSVPAWAIAEIESQDIARYGDPTRRPHPFAPADLADACLWAIRHRSWIDRTAGKEGWPDRRLDAEIDKASAVFTRAIREPSTSLREIMAKAALALEDFERFTLNPAPTPDDGTRIVHTVLREVVGVGREAGAPSPLAHYGSLGAAILTAWAAWRATTLGDGQEETPENLAAWEQASAEMNRLCDLAADLPATSENITAKALAAAWGGWAYSERPRQPRAHYPTDERCLFDINAAIMARGVTDEAGGPRPADLLAAAGLSLEALPVSDLCSIFDAAEILSEVAAALACQPRHMTKGSFNGAGILIENTAFALNNAIDAVARELRSRTPANRSEQAERLAALARFTIHNDHDDQTAALARELLAMVER